jgi:hypothetical protein
MHNIVDYEEDINDAIYTFNNISSIDELQQLTLDFLKGKIIATNYHFGPLHQESKKIINELIKMNELGFITTCSQPGDQEQRGYVCGIINKYDYTKFEKKMYEISNNIYIRHTNDNKLIKTLSKIKTYPEWYWITHKNNKNITHVNNNTKSFEFFIETDIYSVLINNYYEIEIIDIEWDRENYIHKKIIVALEIDNTNE